MFFDIINSFIQNQTITIETLGTSLALTLFALYLFWEVYDFTNSSIVEAFYDKKKVLKEDKPKYNEKPSFYCFFNFSFFF